MKTSKEKYKNLVLYLCQKCASKENFGKTLLYKLLYFCDFDYYELYEKPIIGETYIKLNHGPVPRSIEKILKELKKEGKLKIVETHFHGHKQQKPISLQEADLSVFSGDELEVIRDVLDKYSHLNAVLVSDLSHRDMPWRVTEDNKVIDYELVFYRTPETSLASNG